MPFPSEMFLYQSPEDSAEPPALAGTSAAMVLASFREAAQFDLGDFESSAARKLRMRCQAHGLRIAEQAYRAVHLSLPIEISNTFLRIEDAATNEAVAKEAIEQGLPVRNSTA